MLRRFHKLALFFVALVLGLALWANDQDNGSLVDFWHYLVADYRAGLEELERTYGIEIRHAVDENFLPRPWRDPRFGARVEPLDELELSRFHRVLKRALAKYPEKVLRRNLHTIYLCRSLELVGVGYGGTNWENDIYLTSEGRTKGYDDFYLELTFHHELSSVLMTNYDFPQERWLEANPPDVEYATDDGTILKAIEYRGLNGTSELYQRGLLAAYAASTLENDVNLYAETVFVDPTRMHELVGTFGAVRSKFRILEDFYLGIDPSFENVFAAVTAD